MYVRRLCFSRRYSPVKEKILRNRKEAYLSSFMMMSVGQLIQHRDAQAWDAYKGSLYVRQRPPFVDLVYKVINDNLPQIEVV